jgi:hypothetical protein
MLKKWMQLSALAIATLLPPAAGMAGTSFPHATPTPTQLFEWAEAKYATIFPSHEATQALPPFLYRFYPATGNYVAVAADDVYLLGPVSGGVLTRVASLSDLACLVIPDNCYISARPLSTYSLINAKPDIDPLDITTIYREQSTKKALVEFGGLAYGYGDFKGDGRLAILIASQNYDPTQPASQAGRGHFEFFTQDANGKFISDPTLYAGNAGCIHPRKAVVADFNGDGRPDIFVACHGYDAEPFPGEDSYILLSGPSGTYTAEPVSIAHGFTHHASAADIDGNGTIDLVLADPKYGSRLLLNDGSAHFTVKALPAIAVPAGWGYDIADFADINGDGKPDLFLGSNENNDPGGRRHDIILLGDGTSTYSAARSISLPQMPSAPVTLDIAVVDLDGDGRLDLIVDRTTDQPNFYQGRGLQVLRNLGSSFSTVFEWTGPGIPGKSGLKWVPWIRYRAGRVIADDVSNNFDLPLP